jgi:hypothetical protein
LDNFDDGSNVAVELGQVNVLRNKVSKPLDRGQSYSVNLNDNRTPVVGRAGEYDDFDKWVSGRIDAVATATNYSSQYVNSPDYSAGFADLYNYGSFYNIAGYGYGWQPYGVGLGWNPFAFGGWYSDPLFGWSFIGSAPWGWLPYHYGGWVFSPIYGWVWMPTGFGYGGYGYGGSPLLYHPITAVFLHSGTTTGLVPMNPADQSGKTPINLAHGVYPLQGNTIGASTTPAAAENWSVIKNPPRDTVTASTFAATAPPTRVSRTILSGRAVTLSRDSSIVYDASQHRFVNNGNAAKAPEEEAKAVAESSGAGTASNSVAPGAAEHGPSSPTVARATTAVRPHINPPNPPSNGGSSHSSNAAAWEGDASNSSNSANSSHTVSSAPAGHSGGGHH